MAKPVSGQRPVSPNSSKDNAASESDVDKVVSATGDFLSQPPSAPVWSMRSYWPTSFRPGTSSEIKDKEISQPAKLLSNTLHNSDNHTDAILFKPHIAGEEVPSNAVDTSKASNIIVPEIAHVLPKYSLLGSMYSFVSEKLHTPTNEPHLFHMPNPTLKPIKRVLIIGVHGFFPNKFLRPIIGHPTGTSFKFIDEAEKAIVNYFHSHEGVDIENLVIQKIALEKEGKIFDRVDFFFNLMYKWRDDVLKADFIYIAAHSQGVPVTTILLGKLISLGFFEGSSPKQKIGILGMAGINNGPFFGMDQALFVKLYKTLENESLLELFEFQKMGTLQSAKLLESLKIVINYNVKICYVASLNDPLVPVYSALNLEYNHANIYRGIFIDENPSTTSPFLKKLLEMNLNLLNTGHKDHGLLKNLSKFLQGPLTGSGHSTLYGDSNVYQSSLQFILETTTGSSSKDNSKNNVLAITMASGHEQFEARKLSQQGGNPYITPWCLRGMLTEYGETYGNKEGTQGEMDLAELVDVFDTWKPEEKSLKQLKYSLSGLKAKL
ncbi:hypothetical protein BABINDRAFT_160501 [Babjeviella inositovora NRRL Y-12698]|uniref:YMC020W-like alpha/beta hydrolase domain-containing protein n=1 Tax=Babjeviella inositovora NRRL Y-12698 TaxID=984486 RepID=A0A1E3QVJ3_9ASCO|nr:uncharacterized protein BABINDRAFT_160501 [Babjeviella inositovora NRRL Y-12698]ODQ81092.1 hypothetical protein BABINDRAFT_160501 [Babjeviella inositovora NRRL Y-12698]